MKASSFLILRKHEMKPVKHHRAETLQSNDSVSAFKCPCILLRQCHAIADASRLTALLNPNRFILEMFLI